MAEEEKIREHAKYALQNLVDKTKGWKERLRDFAWEVFIIIVAVNVTLWFHNWSDKRHDREMEKKFLISINQNLNNNTDKMNGMLHYLSDSMLHYYDTILVQVKTNTIDTQYINSHSQSLLSSKTSNLDFGLFESFKSAGNLRLIENQDLLTDITNLYSADLPFRKEEINQVLAGVLNNFDKYAGVKMGFNKSLYFPTLSTHLKDPEILYFIQKSGSEIYFLIQNMKGTVSEMDRVGEEIDHELKDRFGYDITNKN